MSAPDWIAIGSGVGAGVTAVFAKMGVDKARGGNGSALKEKVEVLTDTLNSRVITKLDAIMADVADTKERVSKVEGYLAGRKDGLTE